MTAKTRRARHPRDAGFGRLGFAALVVCSAVPFFVERSGQRLAEQRLEAERIEIGLDGLTVSPFSATTRGKRLSAATLHVSPELDGIHVRAAGVTLENEVPGEVRSDKASPDSSHAPKAQPSDPPAPWATPLRKLIGIPIFAEVEGKVRIELGDGVDLELDRPRLHLPGDGTAETNADLVVLRQGKPIGRAHVDATTRHDSREILVAALASTKGGASIELTGRVLGTESASFRLTHPRGGTSSVEIQRSGRSLDARIEAQRFPIDVAGRHIDTKYGSLDVTDAQFAGLAEIHADDTTLRVHLEDATVSGTRLQSRYLSREVVSLDALSTSGDASWTRAPRPSDGGSLAGTIAADLLVTHGEAQLQLSGQLDPRGSQLGATLPRLDCQALADSMPEGLLPTLAGMQWDGEIDGTLDLAFDLSDVRAFASADDAPETTPGRAKLEFDFFERCHTLSDAPGVDLEGLEGPYRHRYVSAGGLELQRIMAVGAPGFVPASRVPDLGLAFLILEDSRFWHHDGFDREQIERALWHNLGVGRISRGASTISQQTARNLWLGVDRSVGRKIQEAVLTARLESQVSKKRILELYLNLIELGPDVHGVREAALFHFGREPEDLNLLEALHLAAHAPAPVTYSRRFATGVVDAQWRDGLENQVRRLRLHGLISDAQARSALRAPLRLRVRTPRPPA